MAGFLDNFRKSIISSLYRGNEDSYEDKDINDRIALGVLLWVVAEADGKFLPQEETKIREVLKENIAISDQDLHLVLASVEKAAKERIDLYTFTNEVSKNLDYAIRATIVEDLFRVACSDKYLDNSELEAIREISNLFHLSHKDFIEAKIKVKKEFGLDTAGF